MKFKEFDKPEYFVNRELSWIKFDDRVLSEARDKNLPLFERLKFLSITSSNLDEFYMVRVASLKDQVHAGYKKTDIAGMTAKEQLKAISRQTHDLVHVQYSTLNRSLVPALEKAGLHVIFEHEAFSEKQKEFVDQYFEDNVYPVLTPMAMDSSRPFPLIRNKTLNIGALLSKKDTKKGKEEIDFATVQVPSVLPRVVIIPSEKKGHTTVTLLEQIIERNIDKLFLSYDVICAHPYRIMRNADLPIDEDEAEDLLVEIQKQLKKRQWGEVIRLEVEDKMDPRLLDILKMEFQVHGDDIFFINGPLDLTMLMKVYGIDGYDQFKEPKYKPAAVPAFQNDKDIFQVIREGDVFLHHPYMSFDPVVNFVRQAAKDPDVLAIKQTLYRVSGNSPIIAALAQAAENGKQVSVLVELKARFDEENNIVWAKMLEKAGCHVIYGLVGLKTHSKITLVVRREENGIRRYVHLATGNYNDSTAKLYTDCGIFTCDERFGEDATAVFNMLSGYSEPKRWNRLIVAPIWMKDRFVKMIEREAEHAKKGEEAHIAAKMNSLCDPEIIAATDETLEAFYKELPALELYRKQIAEIRRMKEHCLSAEMEKLLAMTAEMSQTPADTFSILNNADLVFPEIEDENGEKVRITHGRYGQFLQSADRRVRKDAFENLYQTYKQFLNTSASLYCGNVKQQVFHAKARKYVSSLECAVDANNVSSSVYHNLIDTVNKNLDKMHQYVSLRKKCLGVGELHMYDIYTPMIADVAKKISFEEAKETVLKALAPLGEDYVNKVKEGFENRWIDVYENQGKRSGAYSAGAYGCHPYVLLNYNGTLDDMFTLAHEMGHAMHSNYSNEAQPYIYAGYKIFVAEVASTCNEILLMEYLLKNTTDKKERAYLLNHYLDSFKGTVYRQTQFAEYEMLTNKMYEDGESLTADNLSSVYLELNKKYYGSDIISDEHIAYEWARIPHFYYNFYVYQYATSYCAAFSVAHKILEEGTPAVERYKKFLSGGCSMAPVELLKIAGVNLETPAPIQDALNAFGEIIKEMETLVED